MQSATPMVPVQVACQINAQVVTLGYVHKADHRDRTAGKAQWSIGESDERAAFQEAMQQRWLRGKFAWGLHHPTGKAEYLGVDRDHRTRVFIARFDEHQTAEWHGYPVNHQNPQQRPPETVLRAWSGQALRPALVRKIMQGQRCNP